jgi:transcriptional regulator with XRE-family HTH domain
MGREREEIVQRITARYVEEVRSGRRPDMSDYLSLYPQYADEIADFVAYYHAFEVGLPFETHSMPVLSGQFQGAINTAWERVLSSPRQTGGTIISLLETAAKRHVTASQLAERLGLSVDILAKLEQHAINAATIPMELITLLAKILYEPSSAVQEFFGIAQRPQMLQVAEAQALYQVDKVEKVGGQAQSFREAIQDSEQLSEEQRQAWYTLLEHQGL